MKPPVSIPEDDFHTRLLNEHWRASHDETKDQIQARIDEILKGTKRK